MKFEALALFCFILFLTAGCSKKEKNIEHEVVESFSTEEEKLLNEVFLSIIGTDLYYKISEKEMDKVYEIESKEGEDKAKTYYEEHRQEDPTKIIVFTKDEFHHMYSSTSKTIMPDRLQHIKNILANNDFDTTQVLTTLSQPLALSSIKLIHTGRYQIIRLENKNSVKGKYKAFGSFNTSKVYIDQTKERAVFIYERNCIEGTKCAEGNLLILKNGKDGWKIVEELNLYVT